jgi:AcrR family transcriptional regulator
MSAADIAHPPASRAPGRPRDQVAHDSILDAAVTMLDECCYSEITIEKIAARAGVGKPTIYRRWKTKAEVMLEAYARRIASHRPPYIPSEDVFADLVSFLDRMFIAMANPVANRALRCFIAESQHDEDFRPKFYELFLAGRRRTLAEVLEHGKAIGQIRRDLDNEIVADILYGAYSARLITGHAPLDRAFAEKLIETLRPALAPPLR